MMPTKKIQQSSINESQAKTKSPPSDEDSQDEDPEDDQYNASQSKKQRKRRTLSETTKRDFVCGCGKSYVSYPAIYLHVQRKHNGEWPPNTLIPEKSDNQDKVKR